MDRSEELQKIIEIYVTHESSSSTTIGKDGVGKEKEKEKEKESKQQPSSLSNIILLALQIYEGIYQNEDLVKQIERYAAMKEFSNDPTKHITELSQIFEQSIQQIQLKNQKLKIFIDQSTSSNQILQHYRLIQQYLSKAVTNQVTSFKHALKEHQKHIEERNKRIEKYGGSSVTTSNGSSSSSSTSSSSFVSHNNPIIQQASTSQYAMFQAPNNTVIPPPSSIPNNAPGGPASSLTHRRGGRSGTAIITGNSTQQSTQPQPYYPLPGATNTQHVQVRKDDQRLRQAEKAEATIKQMGHLFSQMATLISEQSEVIMRIEDDVEAGYSNTIEGYKSLETVYAITKGNRSMILKIFALIIFFMFLFLVWT